MKKFLSIKNSQGIYVARASFSSNETVIDFANNSSNTNNSNNTKPVSIVVTPGQASSTSSLPIAAVVCEPDDSEDTRLIRANQLCIGSQTGSELSLVSKASSSKKKRFSKVLRVLHLKGKSKMGDHTKEAKSKRATESPTSSGSTQSLPKPEKIGKGRTAALVKKFSITSKKSTSSGPSDKKSSIPLRKATSGETFPNVKQKSHGNLELVTTATSEIISTATTTTYSSSEMNLVNIDYRQESTDDLNVGIKLGQTDYQNYSSNRSDKIGGSGGGSGNLSRAWNTSSNLSTSVDKNRIGGVRGGSSEKLQITISGKKRNSTEYLSDLQHKQQQQQQQQQPQQFENVEQKKLERKTLAMQPNKVNISHDLTLMNTVGVPTSATQIPSMPSSYRITTGSIKKVVQSGAGIKRQSTMQSKQTFDVSASTVAAESSKANVPPASEPMTSASALGNIVVTSFDADETEEIAANLLKEQDEDDKETTSLLNEINEAERRNSMSMDRGRRFPGVAASEAIKFSHQPTDAAPAPPTTTTTTSDATVEAKRQPPPIPISVVPKVIINQPTLAESDSLPVQSDKKAKSVKTETVNESENENENDLMQSLSSSTGAKLLQEATDDGNDVGKTVGDAPPSPSLQFERHNMSSSPEKREHLYKILVIGELGTGKTSFIKRYVHQFFSQNYRATIGVDFALKVLNWDQNTIIRLQLWDIAGQERFGNMTRVYYKEAVGAFIVFDVTRSATFDAVIKWKQDLDSKVQLPNGSPIPCILIANKCDQAKQGIVNTPAKMDDYVREHGFAGWFETSAKENINIEEAARALVNKILLNDKIINAGEILDSDKFNLDGGQSDRPKKNCSC